MIQTRLDAFLDEQGYDELWFLDPANVAWLTGADTRIDASDAVGVAAACYDGDGVTVLAGPDADRLQTEELDDDVAVETFAWYESSLEAAVVARASEDAAADLALDGLATVDAYALRQPLVDGDIERYDQLGQDVAGAVEAVCRELQSGDSEHEVGSAVRIALAARDIEPVSIFVGGAARAQRFVRPRPTALELGDYVVVSVTGRRDGLHAGCTRTVAFDAPEWLEARHEAAARVEATAYAATASGVTGEGAGTVGDVFAAIQSAYDAVGSPDRWQAHPQGGATGYSRREWLATPESDVLLQGPMAYAWTPSLPGVRREDTTLVTADGMVDRLTDTGGWPIQRASAVGSDETYSIPAVLSP
ncbi:Xaa-Pro peptidase family protein [Haloarchaeobius sp. HME9146]|uniref:M24 family metallopeptidase n=1 Tax=Haloarchaeobius sp. HME9146 TaxID=2978732 RepID=UPI0021BF0DD1|nr:M24 family metallopeptidase [Haloarchaeobius sp. HME9146]MCT9097501.1 M24 family metallopeptidase [Haloarchaeobius sp. HME9146]